MQRLVFYVKTRGFRTIEPFGGVQWGSVWLLFGVLVLENTRFLCAEASFLRKNTRFSRSGPFGAPLGLCLDAVCFLLAPCGALLLQNYVFFGIANNFVFLDVCCCVFDDTRSVPE